MKKKQKPGCEPITILKYIEDKAKQAMSRFAANIDASLQNKPLPYPPPKERCPHCLKEIE